MNRRYATFYLLCAAAQEYFAIQIMLTSGAAWAYVPGALAVLFVYMARHP